MCDFSLQAVKSRDAKVGDELVVTYFGTGTRGFAAVDDLSCAVCVKPGTEIAFAKDVATFGSWGIKRHPSRLARFRQVNKDKLAVHHDALELANGTILLLTMLEEGQRASVLQLPAAPKTPKEAENQRRAAYVG